MDAPLLIIGQGLAGSMLGWACEQAGVAFRIVDRGHDTAASRVGAGLVSPLTGRRLVPTWRFAEWRDEVVAIYRELERELGVPLLREVRLHRIPRDEAERRRFDERGRLPEVAAWIETADALGLGLRGAFQVDTGALIAGLRARWLERGWLEEGEGSGDATRTVWCTGAEAGDVFPDIPWEPSLGQVLEGDFAAPDADVVRNDGQWLLPVSVGRARVGATFEREYSGVQPTAAGRAELQAAAQRLGGRPLGEPLVAQAGLRVTVPDRRPVVGWDPAQPKRGVVAGLAAKGTLWAPMLARQWVKGWPSDENIEPEARVGRF